MELFKKIPSNTYLIVSVIFITTAIALLFLGKILFVIISLLIGLITLVAWTFLGLFDDTKNT